MTDDASDKGRFSFVDEIFILALYKVPMPLGKCWKVLDFFLKITGPGKS